MEANASGHGYGCCGGLKTFSNSWAFVTKHFRPFHMNNQSLSKRLSHTLNIQYLSRTTHTFFSLGVRFWKVLCDKSSVSLHHPGRTTKQNKHISWEITQKISARGWSFETCGVFGRPCFQRSDVKSESCLCLVTPSWPEVLLQWLSVAAPGAVCCSVMITMVIHLVSTYCAGSAICVC